MNINLLSGLQYESVSVIYAVMAFLVIIGRRSSKLFYCIIFSLIVAGLTTGFYIGTNGMMPMIIAFIVSFFINFFISLIAFAISDRIDPDSTFSYLLLWEIFYNASYFLIVFIVNSMIK